MQMSYWLLETLTLVHTLQNKLGLLYLVVAPLRISFFDSRCPLFAFPTILTTGQFLFTIFLQREVA